MTPAAVLDTHALIWIGEGQRRLGRAARRLVARVDAGLARLVVPTVAIVEVSEGLWRGRIKIEAGFNAWLDELIAANDRYEIVDLNVAIVRRASELFAIPERGDRLIAATARELDLPLITRDPAIAKVAGVDVLW